MKTPRDIYEHLTRVGTEWAEADEAASLLEETKKATLAEIMNRSTGSQAAREMAALCHPDYREHVEKMVKARTKANIAKVRYEAAKVWVDMLRTQAANERATLKTAP